MDVFGEPVGWELVAASRLAGLAVDQGAGGRELVSKAQVVQEAGDLLWRGATGDLAGDEILELGQGLEVELTGQLPALAFLIFRQDQSPGGGVDRLTVV